MNWDWERDPLACFCRCMDIHVDESRENASSVDLLFTDFDRHPKYPEPIPVQKLQAMDESREAFTNGPHWTFGFSEGHWGAKSEWIAPNRLRLYPCVKPEGKPFNPFNENDWKILLSKNAIVTQHIIKEVSKAIHRMQENVMTSEAVVEKIWFSSVKTLRIRESYSMELEKVIYEKVGYPSNRGGFEKAFSEFLDRDAGVECFLKINESQHAFATIFYLRTDGLLASYHPDFIVRTADNIYIIETKGDDKVRDMNVLQKKMASMEWCKKINRLDEDARMDREWTYVLLSETTFYSLSANGATLEDICELNKVSFSEASGRLF
jgi:hypothetical protein